MNARRRTLHSPTRRLLTGATLTLLAVAGVAALGASKAAAAPQHASAKVHKISACGYVAKSPGTYELTKNVTDSGGVCIELNGDNIKLYLDSHTITGDGTDDCIDATGNSNSVTLNNTVVGGSTKKPSKAATLTGCGYGVVFYFISGGSASYLNIDSPATNYAAAYVENDAAVTMSHINAKLGAGKNAYGIELSDGASNTVTNCTVDNNGTFASFYDDYGLQDSFTHDVSGNSYGSPGAGEGFEDYYSSRNNWSHDTSKGQPYGFYLYEDGYGPVTATYDSASFGKTTSTYGFYIYLADQESDSGSPFHTLISHDKATGFQYGFFDETDSEYFSVAEKWIDNTADNYSEYGFYIYYPSDYTMTGNVADGDTQHKKYDGTSTTYGFYLYDPYSYYPFKTFSKNQAYDSEYGFYSDEEMVGGKGNVAKRNKYNSYDVQIG